MNTNKNIVFSFSLLRYAYGLVILLAGLDKVLGTNLIVAWPKYVSPFVAGLLPVSVGAFIIIIGIVEIVVALFILSKLQKIGGYVAAAWLVLISINLFLLDYRDIAIRDILLATGAIVLAKLKDVVDLK